MEPPIRINVEQLDDLFEDDWLIDPNEAECFVQYVNDINIPADMFGPDDMGELVKQFKDRHTGMMFTELADEAADDAVRTLEEGLDYDAVLYRPSIEFLRANFDAKSYINDLKHEGYYACDSCGMVVRPW